MKKSKNGARAVEQESLGEVKLVKIQKSTFGYFLKEANLGNGMVPDSTRQDSAASIAAIGFALTAYPVGVERGFVTRAEAVKRTLTTLRFFRESEQSAANNATGYEGFYYHFLDMETGRRAHDSELSTIDSAFLFAGMLTAARYFNRDTAPEREIREHADALFARANWQWALNGKLKVSHGWKPGEGFLEPVWEGYSEALILYLLGLGAPDFSLPAASYEAWTQSYEWKELCGLEFLYAGPIFIHQLSHVWVDFRGIQDDYMRAKGITYFDNSRRATLIQQEYAVRNPNKFTGYGKYCWGITASDGPGPAKRKINGRTREFFDYLARGVPDGPDDGTLAPWAILASLPFAPEIVLPSIKHFDDNFPEMTSKYGFKCSYNPTFSNGPKKGKKGWISQGYYGLDQGPIVMMIENYRSGFLWRLMRDCPVILRGLRRAGFTGGWLGAETKRVIPSEGSYF
ncbi:MAG: glucoamylase family protein [Verrucomicrobiota bacterium]